MSVSQRFRLVNSQYARVCRLIHEAERTSDPVRAGDLYRTARSLTIDITQALREGLTIMGTARTALDDAA